MRSNGQKLFYEAISVREQNIRSFSVAYLAVTYGGHGERKNFRHQGL